MQLHLQSLSDCDPWNTTVIQLLIMNFVVFGSVSVNEILVGSLAFGINSGAT